jgi:hypothetical protein
MRRTIRKAVKIGAVMAVLAVLFWALPLWAVAVPVLVYLLFGIIDVARNDMGGVAPVLKRYFFGNGLLTWALSPFNLLMDLLSKRTGGILRVSDLPADMQEEIEIMLAAVRREKDGIVARIEARNTPSERVMLMYKW